MKLIDALRRGPPFLTFAIGIILITLVSWIDYLTGPYLTLSLFYLFPIAVITWYCGNKYGYASVIFSAGLVLAADLLWKLPNPHSYIPYWNTVIKMVIFIVIVVGISRIKADTVAMKQAAQRETQLARTDALTGIANSRSFYEFLENEMNKSRRYDHSLSVAYIDLDNFKDANDRYGHIAGDEILRKIAEIITRSVRNIDTAARLGGDEFAVLMPETDMDNARVVAQRLLKVIAEEAQKNNWAVTASIGVGSYNKIPVSSNTIISNVDDLMYQAKSNGKNRIEEHVFYE